MLGLPWGGGTGRLPIAFPAVTCERGRGDREQKEESHDSEEFSHRRCYRLSELKNLNRPVTHDAYRRVQCARSSTSAPAYRATRGTSCAPPVPATPTARARSSAK